jgi:hypothetical protein
MPRGGDDPARGMLTDDAGNAQFAAGIQSQYGEFQNAEDLIRSHQPDPALRRALLTAVDEEATADLEQEDAEALFDLEEGEKLASYAVHGNALVGVIESPNGALSKAVTGANEDYEEPALTPAEAATKAQAEHDQALAREAAKLRQEMELKLAEAQADLQAENAEAMESIRAEAQEALAKALEEAGAAPAEAEAPAAKAAPKAAPKAKS